MTPTVRSFRLPREYLDAFRRVEEAADTAAKLVSRRMGVRLDRTEIVVTTGASASDVLIDAHRRMFGARPAIWKLKGMHRGDCGAATISKAGVLVVINADRCQPRAKLNATLVHELVHAAQLSRSGGRDVIVRNLRNNYGITPMSGREVRTADQQVAADEREAERLESLASELPI